MKLCQQFVVDVVYKGWKDQMFTAEQIKHLESEISDVVQRRVKMMLEAGFDELPAKLKLERVEATYNGDDEIDS